MFALDMRFILRKCEMEAASPRSQTCPVTINILVVTLGYGRFVLSLKKQLSN